MAAWCGKRADVQQPGQRLLLTKCVLMGEGMTAAPVPGIDIIAEHAA